MNDEASAPTRVMFVDDSKVMLKTASKILSAEFEVVTAVDGDDAWGKLENDHSVQVLFTDINMPNTDGYALLGKVRTSDDQGLSAMPVILVTGADDDDTARQRALERGATDFINKKFLSTELLPRARAHAKYQRITLQLQAATRLDTLTGLANEEGFVARLEQDIAYARRHAQGLALMRVEIGDLDAIVRNCPHAMVEQIIALVAGLIRKRVREEDTAGRVGMGAFAISLPGGHRKGVEAMAAFLHDKAAHALAIDGQAIAIRLITAVVSTDEGMWASTIDALNRSQAALDHVRGPRAAHAAPAASEPVTPVPTPAAAPTKTTEKIAVTAPTAAPEPAPTPEPATADTQWNETLRQLPPRQRAPVPRRAHPLQAMGSFFASLGAVLRGWWSRWFGK